MAHAIDYIELAVDDLGQAKAFYAEALGWTFTDYGPGYTCFHDGRLAGGFTTDETPGGHGALVVLHNLDLEASRERVIKAGGRIVKEIFPYPGGRRFHFADPSGNVLAVCSEA